MTRYEAALVLGAPFQLTKSATRVEAVIGLAMVEAAKKEGHVCSAPKLQDYHKGVVGSYNGRHQARTRAKSEVLAALKGRPMTIAQVAEVTKRGEQGVNNYLLEMMDAGIVGRTKGPRRSFLWHAVE